MTVVGILDTLTAWAEENICKKVYLKVPPDDNEAPNDADYEYKRVNPACFTMYVPGKDRLPPDVSAPVPSLCVRCVDGSDSLADGSRNMRIEFCISVWETGINGRDILLKSDFDSQTFHEWNDDESKSYFRRHGGSWRDAWNFVDTVLRELEGAVSLNGIALDKSQPVTFEPLKEQESIPDYHPFYFAVVGFTVQTYIIRNDSDYSEFL